MSVRRFATQLALPFVALGLVVLIAARWPIAPLPPGAQADAILVEKKERRLTLLANGAAIRSYRIALGPNPVGHKERFGDGRTPEGTYWVERRLRPEQTSIGLKLSYPNERDTLLAVALGVRPGRDVMIHGLPDGWGFIGRWHRLIDWTAGGIALTNEELQQILGAVPDGTPIELVP